MIAGRIHGGFETTSVMLAHLHEGKIRGLGVLRDERLPQLPDVPTMIESGVDGVTARPGRGARAGGHAAGDRRRGCVTEVMAAAHSPEVHDRLKMLAAEPEAPDVPTSSGPSLPLNTNGSDPSCAQPR